MDFFSYNESLLLQVALYPTESCCFVMDRQVNFLKKIIIK